MSGWCNFTRTTGVAVLQNGPRHVIKEMVQNWGKTFKNVYDSVPEGPRYTISSKIARAKWTNLVFFRGLSLHKKVDKIGRHY